MKTWKKIIAIILCSVVFVVTTAQCEKKVEAASIPGVIITVAGAVVTAYELVQIHNKAYESYHNGAWSDIQDWAVRNFGPIGFIMTVNPEAELIDRVLKPFLESQGIILSSDSDEEAFDKFKSYVNNHYHLENDGTITYDESMKNTFNGLINAYANDSGYYYVYSSLLTTWTSDFGSGEQYTALRNFLSSNPDKIVNCGTTTQISNGLDNIYVFPYTSNYGFIAGNTYPQFNLSYHGNFYSMTDWEMQSPDVYTWNNTSKKYELNENYEGSLIGFDFRLDPLVPKTGNGFVGVLSIDTQQVLAFRTIADLKKYSVGELPYYYNNEVYNDWSSSTGDYTVTTDNSNKTTYGDITNYINSFNQENGYTPSPNDINVFIENYDPTVNPTPTPNPNNPSGGGSSAQATANNEGINITINNNHSLNFGGSSVSGNTVSGNGSGSSGGIAGIFDFLSQIGDVLGNLVKNVGHVLAELVTGIGETISSLLEGIPTIFGDFMGALLGWLPDELQALITLSISAMIIVGVIKLFRG